MGRPPLGPAKRSRTIAIHVTQSQYELIEQQGQPSVWARRAVLDALLAAVSPPKPAELTPTGRANSHRAPAKAQPAKKPAATLEPTTPHRHKRERVRDGWVGGQNVGVWKCGTCGEPLSPR